MPPRNLCNRNPGIERLGDVRPFSSAVQRRRRPTPVRISTRPNKSFVSRIVSVICAKPSRQISEKPATSRARASRWGQRTAYVEIVKRSDQAKGFVVLPKRWVVERTFAWLGRCRRLAKDWENLNRRALAFLRLASIRLMLRKLCNPGDLSGQTLRNKRLHEQLIVSGSLPALMLARGMSQASR